MHRLHNTLLSCEQVFTYVHYIFGPEGPSSGVEQILKFKTTASQYGAILYTVADPAFDYCFSQGFCGFLVGKLS
jgi:hypothetical protein